MASYRFDGVLHAYSEDNFQGCPAARFVKSMANKLGIAHAHSPEDLAASVVLS